MPITDSYPNLPRFSKLKEMIAAINAAVGGAVSSVAGRTGVVTLVKGDVGLGSVDNTADSAKPVSTAQASADAAVLSSANTYTDGKARLRSLNVSQSGAVNAGSANLTDYFYLFTSSGTLTLPTAVGNANNYTVKNSSGVNITVIFTSGQNADGSTSITIVPGQSLDFISNNTNYVII